MKNDNEKSTNRRKNVYEVEYDVDKQVILIATGMQEILDWAKMNGHELKSILRVTYNVRIMTIG